MTAIAPAEVRLGRGMNPDAAPVRTSGWELAPYADNSAAFVFSSAPIGVRVLDRITWFVLELCDGRTAGAILERAQSVLGSGTAALELVEGRLQTLAAGGLVIIETGTQS